MSQKVIRQVINNVSRNKTEKDQFKDCYIRSLEVSK